MKKFTLALLILFSIVMVGCTSQPIEQTPVTQEIDEASVEAIVQAYLDENTAEPQVIELEIDSFNDLMVNLVKKVDTSTVLVGNVNDLEEVNSTGSAVVYKEKDGYFYAVTNNHVVDGSVSLRVYFEDLFYYEAELVGTDPETDVAVIRFQGDEEKVVTVCHFGDINELERGQIVMALGSPGGITYFNSSTMGIISGLERFVGIEDLDGDGYDDVFVKMLQHDAAINPGNSGGPLFNLEGEIIGINTIKLVSDDIEGMGFSIYIDVVQRVIEDLEEFGAVQRTRLGVWILDVRYATDGPAGVRLGVLVQEIIEDGPMALTSDIEVGDVIVEFGGIEVDGVERLKDIIFQYHPGEEVEFKVFRDGEIISTTVVLGEK